MHVFAGRLTARYPLLSRICIGHPECLRAPEATPAFFGIFLAALDVDSAAPLCFVLPRCGDAARLAAVMFGLYRFGGAEAELAKRYGEATFRSGDDVRVHPSKHVYTYLGFDADFPNLVFLKPPNGTPRERRSFDARAVLRLERTTMKRPLGKMNTPIHDPIAAPLDLLIGTSSFGNQALFRNEVVLLDSSSGFEAFAETTSFKPSGNNIDYPALKSLIPIGKISPPTKSRRGWFEKWDDRNPTGEPLIAVTSSAEQLASFCVDAETRSRVVIVNGVSRLRDLQYFDDVSQTQRLILFADRNADEMLDALADRGCRFWHLKDSDITEEGLEPTDFDGVVGKLRVWARNEHRLTIDAECVDSPMLDGICIRLEGLREFVDSSDQSPVAKLVARLWRMLNDAAAIIRPLEEPERRRALMAIQEFARDLEGLRAWLAPTAEEALKAAASEMKLFFVNSQDPGEQKRNTLDRLVRDSIRSGVRCMVLARTQNQVAEVSNHLRKQIESGQVRVAAYRALKADRAYDRFICVSWPNSDTMQDLAASLSAPQISLIGCAFERRWLNQCTRRMQLARRASDISSAEKTAIIDGIEFTGAISAQQEPTPPLTDVANLPDDDVWAFERRLRLARKGTAASPTDAYDTVPCRYLSFVGSTYAFLTETHKVVVVTDLLSTPHGRVRQRLPERTVDGLKAGDFIVFPESGDRELIQETADQLLGKRAIELRQTAKLWKEALQRSGITPAHFWKEAQELRRPRHIMTIRNWFAETSQIGPGNGSEELVEDLELISLVTDDQTLKVRLQDVMEAVKTLRGAHLSAGSRLRDMLIGRLPQVISRIEEEGSVIDLGELGSAWIVQIESIALTSEPRGRSEVNRVMSDRAAHAFHEQV